MTQESTPEGTAATLDYIEQEMFAEWIEHGVKAGWIAEPNCMTHNPVPLRPREETEFEDGYDPCIIAIRVWRDGYRQEGDDR
jgi:hypothetical protein